MERDDPIVVTGLSSKTIKGSLSFSGTSYANSTIGTLQAVATGLLPGTYLTSMKVTAIEPVSNVSSASNIGVMVFDANPTSTAFTDERLRLSVPQIFRK